MIAKTDWIANMVKSNHNVTVHKVVPSLDHEAYYTDHISLKLKATKRFENGSKFTVIGMIRPRTAFRNPWGVLDVLLKLAFELPNSVKVDLFGSSDADILGCVRQLAVREGPAPHRNESVLRYPNVRILGLVSRREDIAEMYRRSDIFIDISTWQGFGRSGAEAMSCGCIPIMP